MKGRKIEKQLKNEISTASDFGFQEIMERAHANDDALLEAVPVTVEGKAYNHRGSALKTILFALGALILAFAIFWILQNEEPAPTRSAGYFVIDINPSIKLSYNQDGIITDAQALNEDASVLLVNLDLSGKSADDAVSILFDKCVALGYFSSERDNNAVMTSATTDNGESDEEMTNEIKRLFSSQFSKKKMRGVVITGVQNAELDATASELGIDSQKYALILSYLDMGGELDTERYDEVSISELYEMISEREKEQKKEDIAKIESERDSKQSELFEALFNSVEALIDKIQAELDNIISEEQQEQNIGESPKGNEPPPNDKGHDDRPKGALGDMMDKIHGSIEKGQQNDNAISRYKEIATKLDEYIDTLEIAKKSNDCKSAFDGILKLLDELSKDEEHKSLASLVSSAVVEIKTLYEEFLEKCVELDEMNVSAEQVNLDRLDAFKNVSHEKYDDVDKWQVEKESEIASSWYEMKKQWNNDRKNDLKK
ncbi:MAG: hypothetical protein IKA43_05645 [Clostridia bacterium]|nr:hypothetical protein [Clostridia bacterium]